MCSLVIKLIYVTEEKQRYESIFENSLKKTQSSFTLNSIIILHSSRILFEGK